MTPNLGLSDEYVRVAVTDRYPDVGTADFFTGLLAQHENAAWMLRATLG